MRCALQSQQEEAVKHHTGRHSLAALQNFAEGAPQSGAESEAGRHVGLPGEDQSWRETCARVERQQDTLRQAYERDIHGLQLVLHDLLVYGFDRVLELMPSGSAPSGSASPVKRFLLDSKPSFS